MNSILAKKLFLENPFSKAIRWLIGGFFILVIKFYKLSISPLLPNSCRFTPTCSQYAIQAINDHGVIKGLVFGVWRIVRCNPWGGHGFDPVPEKGKSAHNH
jgi:putative membrane protein insertion efficiency factor